MTAYTLTHVIGFSTALIIGFGALAIALHHKHKQDRKHQD